MAGSKRDGVALNFTRCDIPGEFHQKLLRFPQNHWKMQGQRCLAQRKAVVKSICFCTSVQMPVNNSMSVSLMTVIIFICAEHGPPLSLMGKKVKHGD